MEYEFYHSYSELYHHGILGMKWGVRRFQNKDGSLTPAGKKRYTADEKIAVAKERYKSSKKRASDLYAKKTREYEEKNAKRSRSSFLNEYSEDDENFDRATDKYNENRKAAKDKYRRDVSTIRKNAVQKYSKEYDRLTDAQDANDDAWRDVRALYKKLGRNQYERFRNAMKNESPEAKAYSRAYDNWASEQEKIDAKMKNLDQMYLDTGANYVDRVINNIRYRT